MRKSIKYLYIVLGILTILLFFFGQGIRWYAMGGDTEAYYIYFGHHIGVKPLYPLFFHALNQIFGAGRYLYAAAVIQIIVAALCIMAFVRFAGERMKLDKISTVILWAACLIPFWLLLPEDPIPHTLMTESFTYPLLYLYVVIVLKGVYDGRERYFYYSVLFAVFMTLIRGQMLFLAAVSLVSYFYFMVKTGKNGGKTGRIGRMAGKAAVFLVVMLLLVKSESLLCAGYEKFFFDAPNQDYSAQTLVQKALFCADRENEGLFTDEIEREIFRRTYSGMEEGGSTYKDFTKGLWGWKHTVGCLGANSYLVGAVIREVLSEGNLLCADEIEAESQVLDYSGRLSRKLIPKNWLRCLKVSVSMMPAGFVSTVLMHKQSIYGLIHAATLILYLAAMAGSILISRWKGELLKETEYMWLIIILAAVNVVSSNLVHIGLQRYLAYTVGMFYAGGYLMARQLFLIWKKR